MAFGTEVCHLATFYRLRYFHDNKWHANGSSADDIGKCRLLRSVLRLTGVVTAVVGDYAIQSASFKFRLFY